MNYLSEQEQYNHNKIVEHNLNFVSDSKIIYPEDLQRKDWKELFQTHKDFCFALHHTKHPLHKHAKIIKTNKDSNLNLNNSFDEITQREIDNYYSNMPRWAR